MRERSADCDMTRRVQELRYEAIRGSQPCYRDAGLVVAECWCHETGLKGVSLPCPEKDKTLPRADQGIPL
jgi:hypothetical protein